MGKQIKPSAAQQEAINTIDGQVILISCPGSGKTSTVVRRVKHMVESGINPSSILVLTFSKAAALEMKMRYRRLCISEVSSDDSNIDYGCGKTGRSVYFSTIHSFCYKIISKTCNYTAENVIQENDEYTIIQRGIQRLEKLHKLSMEIPDKNTFTTSVINEISKVKNNGCDWKTYAAETCPTKDFKTIFDMYETEKRNMGKIDYDDMLLICLQVLTDNPNVLKYYQNIYRYIIIDEFQDTNFIQRDIIYKVAGDSDHANICVVGDDDQSIYKFRGAQPQIMLDFPKMYPNCKQINMDINYRSQPEIVESAKHIISHNENRFAKDIKPNKTGHGIVTYTGCETHLETALVNKIVEMSCNHDYDDMAILYRNNSQAVMLSKIMLDHHVPFHSNDYIPNPYTHWIFCDMMSFYRLAHGNGSNQDLLNVINKPNRYLPLKYLQKCHIDRDSVKYAVMRALNTKWQRGKACSSVKDFFDILELLAKASTPKEFILAVKSSSGYSKYLEEYAKYKNEDVSVFTDYFDMYLDDIKINHLETFEQWMAYIDQFTLFINKINRQNIQGGVTISTMHKSKGLEWPVVFILGANEGIIPARKKTPTGLAEVEDEEEERRLFYVAATRAMDELHVFYTEAFDSERGKSRFVSEMQETTETDTVSETPETNAETVPDEKQKTDIAAETDTNQKSDSSDNHKSQSFKIGMRVNHNQVGTGQIIGINKNGVAVKFDSSPYTNWFIGRGLDDLTVA